ncbi:MAG: LytTR family DNA-binding domain-containing protein [Mucinivorans sp.]
MKVVIVEDEMAAVRNLTVLLSKVSPQTEVVATLDNITDSIEWFSSKPPVELIFMDINLADGSAFEIFNHVHITSPVIFTTAYDEYALNAFRVNCIDYLLKPISEKAIVQALDKLHELQQTLSPQDYPLQRLISMLNGQHNYTSYFLLPKRGDKFFPLMVSSVSYFYIHEGAVRAVTTNGEQHTMPQTLDEVSSCIDPDAFFRISRQWLISREAVLDIDLWFNSRLSINLKIPTEDKILVSKARVAEFKAWFAGGTR